MDIELSLFYDEIFSKARLSRYRKDLDDDNVIVTYIANIILSTALYPLLQMLEVTLRNRINKVLIDKKAIQDKRKLGLAQIQPGTSWLTGIMYEDVLPRDFIEKNCTGGVIKNSLLLKNTRLSAFVINEINDLLKKKNSITHDDIVASFSFGFWVNLFGAKNNILPIWNNADNSPAIFGEQTNTKEGIHIILTKLQNIRNRISHHEPIWSNPYLNQYKNDALTILEMLNPKIIPFLQAVSYNNEYIYNKNIDIPLEELKNTSENNAKELKLI